MSDWDVGADLDIARRLAALREKRDGMSDWELAVAKDAIKRLRNETIEECALKVVELMLREDIDIAEWPAAIRALKDKT